MFSLEFGTRAGRNFPMAWEILCAPSRAAWMTFARPPNISRRWREGGHLASVRLAVSCLEIKRPVLLAGRCAGRTGTGSGWRPRSACPAAPAEVLTLSGELSVPGGTAAPGLAPSAISRVKRLAGISLSTLEVGLAEAGGSAGGLGTAAGWLVCSGTATTAQQTVRSWLPEAAFPGLAAALSRYSNSLYRAALAPTPHSNLFPACLGVPGGLIRKKSSLSPRSVASQPSGRLGQSTSKSPACKSTCEK